MAKIRVEDLTDSVELDREAMQTILGGARGVRTRLQELQQQSARSQESLCLVGKARGKRLARR